MTHSFTLACLWIIAGAVVAFLPMRFQVVLGLILLVLSVPLLFLLARDFGWVAVVAGLAVIGSMFRKPLAALLRHAIGKGRAT